MKKFSQHKKNNSHLILADFGDDYYSLRIQDNGNTVNYSPITPFSFKSVVPFNSKYKKPLKNQLKSLLHQNPLLNETDLSEDPDTIQKRIPPSSLCLLYTSPSPRDLSTSRMPSSA